MQKDGFIDCCYSLIEAFPGVESSILNLIQKFITKEITTNTFSRKIKQIMTNEISKEIDKILTREESPEAIAISRGIFDCVRYKTNIRDAASEWKADEKFLKLMLEQLPTDLNNKLECVNKFPINEVKKKVKTKRECL